MGLLSAFRHPISCDHSPPLREACGRGTSARFVRVRLAEFARIADALAYHSLERRCPDCDEP
jgi:hypothetical protein